MSARHEKQRRREARASGGESPGGARWRLVVVAVLLLAGLGVLSVRLYFEQIHRGENHREQVARQSIRRIRIPAPRGRILSSDLTVLADNLARYDAVFYLEEMRQPGARRRMLDYAMDAARELAARFNRDNPVTEAKLLYWVNHYPGLPFVAFEGLSPEELAVFFEAAPYWRGLGVETCYERIYPCRSLAATLIGYVRKDDPSEAADRREFFYYLPDWGGRGGVERFFNGAVSDAIRGLRGVPGYSLVQVDHLGYVRRELIETVPPEPGSNVVLTIDARAQQIAEELLRGKVGAMVVLDADSGEVLTLATAPGYDLMSFMPGISSAEYQELLEDPDRPLLNRSIQGTYMPGSIIKPLVALAIQNAGVSPEEEIVCDGRTQIGDAVIRCTGVHGPTDLGRALERSCNDYFVEMGIRTGLDAEALVFRSAGLGRDPELELNAAHGQLPDREEFRRRERRAWNSHNTGLLSIGQGMISISPLQAAVYTAALANGGRLLRPHILKSINARDGRVLYATPVVETGRLEASKAALDEVRSGMRRVVEFGSGRSAANQALELSGKTGTAEFGPRDRLRKNTWFIGFGERNQRRYAIAVLVEDSASGGRDCAPLAAAFFLRYLGAEGVTQ